MRERRVFVFAIVVMSLASTLSPAAAQLGSLAAMVGNVQFGTAGPAYWTVLALGSPTNVSITGPSSVRAVSVPMVANVGVPAAGNFSMSDGTVDGTVYLNTAGTANVSGPSVIAGGVAKSAVMDPWLAQARTDALDAAQTANGMPCGPSFPAINNQTGIINGMPNVVNVVCVGQVRVNGGAGSTVTLKAPAGASFLIKVAGDFALTGGAKIILTGGIGPLDVVFYIAGRGNQVALTGGAQLSGIVLAPQRDIAISPGLVTGEVIGGGQQIAITSSGEVQNPTQSLISVE